jgi:hypothetical protein
MTVSANTEVLRRLMPIQISRVLWYGDAVRGVEV